MTFWDKFMDLKCILALHDKFFLNQISRFYYLKMVTSFDKNGTIKLGGSSSQIQLTLVTIACIANSCATWFASLHDKFF
jgi:hypothetical protein